MGIIVAILMRFAYAYGTQRIIDNKGRDENWFWWGFVFGLGALIVALFMPSIPYDNSNAMTVSTFEEPIVKSKDSWKCIQCGRYNTGFSCACGKLRGDNEEAKRRLEMKEPLPKINTLAPEFVPAEPIPVYTSNTVVPQKAIKDTDANGIDDFDDIEEYKNLLAAGIITQEEYDKKAGQLGVM